MNVRLFKILMLFLKYAVVIEAVLITLVLLFSTNSFNVFVLEYICVHSFIGFVLMIIQSYLLQFCNLYRMFLTYNFVVYNCIAYNRYFGFSDFLQFIKIILAFVGISLLILLFKNTQKFFSCEIENK